MRALIRSSDAWIECKVDTASLNGISIESIDEQTLSITYHQVLQGLLPSASNIKQGCCYISSSSLQGLASVTGENTSQHTTEMWCRCGQKEESIPTRYTVQYCCVWLITHLNWYISRFSNENLFGATLQILTDVANDLMLCDSEMLYHIHLIHGSQVLDYIY